MFNSVPVPGLLENPVWWLVALFTLVLIVKLVFDLAHMFAPSWVPEAPLVTLHKVTYAIAEPPLRMMRKGVPPIRIGRNEPNEGRDVMRLDVAYIILMLTCSILLQVLITRPLVQF